MKPCDFSERRRRRQLLAQCRALEWTVKGFTTPHLSIGHGTAAEVAAVNARLADTIAKAGAS